MQMDTDRHEDEIDDHAGYGGPDDAAGPDDSGAYWRRRFIILAGGLAALGLCVWLFPGGHPAHARASARARASLAAVAQGGALPPAAYGSAYPGATTKWPSAASPSPPPSPPPSPAASASAGHPATARRAQPARSGKARKPGTGYHPRAKAAPLAAAPRCAPAGIVLSLFTGQPSYPPQARPRFSVYAVSTSARACALTYGPGSVHIVVTRNGHVVWDSAACKPPAARRVRFTLGVPRVLTMSWNRQATSPSGCAGTLPAGAGGTFDAVALTAGQSSAVHSFELGR